MNGGRDGDYLSWIRLSLVFGYASKRLFKLYSHNFSAESFFYALYYNEEPTATEQEILAARNLPDVNVQTILRTCRELGIKIYCYESEGYPASLRTLANPPAVLYSFGSLDFLNDETSKLQFIGSRNPSEYTKEVLPKIISPLAKLGFDFVSGYADGVDKMTNDIARENMANNAVFLAEPLDAKNRVDELKEIAKGGAVISEFAPGIKNYTPRTYTMRNRLMTCVADALVVCQEGEYGKGLDNISYATSLGKRIYVIPPADIFDPRYFGQRDLLRKGFTPLFSSADIVYGQSKEDGTAVDLSILDASENYLYNPTLPPEKKESKKKKKQRLEKNTRYEHKLLTPQMLDELSETQRSIVYALDNKPLSIDELSLKLSLPANEIVNELTELELDDVLTQDVNKNYYLL